MTENQKITDLGEELEEAGAPAENITPEIGTHGAEGVGARHAGLPVEPESEAIRRLEAERDDYKDKYLRLAAEFDNFRKRTLRERTELGDRSQAAFAVRLLEVLDDLDRMVGSPLPDNRELVEQAVALIDRKLRKELETAGLERIDPVGQPFDPSLHEAVSTTPAESPEQDHIVSATFQAGYRFKGALIRPARVQVYSADNQG